ncbi:hypothetical protein [Moraxella catarrhalis]|uniref:hypothetical protein n=1 Tax=Moraxella catarrhalis TaxID=480 RepID=UPI0006676396|nr:hypothetical protein [Moraxella catarrhalis]
MVFLLTKPLSLNLLAVSMLWVARPSVMLTSLVATMAVVPPDYRFEPSVVMLAVSPVVLMVLLPALVTFDLA